MQLSYQPAFDPFHSIFRLLRLREAILMDGPLYQDHLKILDFYLLFPFRIAGIRLQRDHIKFRRLAKQYAAAKPYGDQPEDRVLFGRMNTMQTVALNTMSANHLIDSQKYDLGTVARTDVAIPDDLAARVEKVNKVEADLLNCLSVLAREYELLGDDGLKSRSRLMEHRYDAV